MIKVSKILKKKIDTRCFRKAGKIAIWLISILLVYTLSLGPALKLAGVKPTSSREEIPVWIVFIYYPLFHCKIDLLNKALDKYTDIWIGIPE